MHQVHAVTTNTLIKSSFWYTVSNYLTKAMVFITTPLFTRILTPKEIGDFSVFASSQAILLIICGMESYSTINRARFDYQGEKELDGYITSALFLSTVFTAFVFSVFLIFPGLFYRFFVLDKKYMYIMFAYLFATPALWMFQAKQRIEYRYKLCAAITFALAILSSTLAVGLALVLKNDRLFGRVFGQYILNILVGIFFYLCFLKKSMDIRASSIKYAFHMGLPLVFSYLGAQLLLSSGIFVVKHMSAGENVGYLYIAQSCAQIILLFVQTLNSAWAPWFFDKLTTNELSLIQNVFRIYMWMIVFCTFGVLIIAPEIIAVMGGSQYKDSLAIFPPVVLCGIFAVLTSQFGNLETYYKKPVYAAILTAIASVVNLVLAIIGVKMFDYRAVSFAMVISNILLILLHYHITISMNIREILPFRDVLAVLLVSLILIGISYPMYRNNLLRVGLLCFCFIAVLIVGFAKRRVIFKLMQEFRRKS